MEVEFCEPWSMVLSTALGGEVFSRVVLLKKVEQGNLFFYSNYQSQKALQLSENPQAAVNFYWDQLGRQVCIRGYVQKAPRKDSENYWRSRPRASQLSQLLSQQSLPIPKGVSLKQLHQEFESKFHNQEIPCPKNWGGYQLKPYTMEFWLNGQHRLHQRWSYQRNQNHWDLTYLYP